MQVTEAGDREVAHAAPGARSPARRAGLPGWAVLTALGVATVAWLFYWGVHSYVFQNDEDQYVYLSRWVLGGLPDTLWNFGVYGRGLQRLEIWMLAVPAAVVDSPWSLVAGKLLNTIAFVSTAIPVYKLGRGLGLDPRWAVLPAALSAVVPWAVVTTSFLTENLAYPAFAWALYAIWRATVAPGARRDVLALLAVLLAGGCRTALLALAPVLPAAVLATELRWAPGGLGARLRAALRGHVVLWAATAVAAVVVVAGIGGLATRLAGGYGTPWGIDLWSLTERSGQRFSRTVIGTGFLPAAVALPWLAVTLARGRDREAFAFAVAAVASALVLFYSLNTAGTDERYVVFFPPLLLLPATVALARREVSAAGMAIASVLLAALVLRSPWNGRLGAFGFFIWPVETFYGRAAGLRLDRYLPGGEQAALAAAAVALGAVGVAVALAARRLSARGAAVLVGVVCAAILAQTQYSLANHVDGAGQRSGPGLRTRAWVDETVPRGASVGEFATGVAQGLAFDNVWRELQFYNQRVDAVYTFGPIGNSVPPGDAYAVMSYDETTGRIASGLALPDYVVASTLRGGAHLRGTLVKASVYQPLALYRLSRPAAIAWVASGLADDDTPAGADAAVRVYGGRCAAIALAAPAGRAVAWRVGRRSGRLGPGEQTTVPAPLGGGPFTDVAIRGGARLADVSVDAGC